MNSLIKYITESAKFDSYIQDINNKISPVLLSGLSDVVKTQMCVATMSKSKKNICIITYNEIQAKKIMNDLENLEVPALYFPKREIVTYDYIAESKDLPYERIDVLNKIYSKKAKIIVTTIEAINQKMISKEVLYKNIINLSVGKVYDLEKLKEKLTSLGYSRADIIEGRAQFAVRGGIVDIGLSDKNGVRIEFLGDEVDSIRYFNISSQRSTEMAEKIEIYPAHEFLLETSIDEICKQLKNTITTENTEDILNKDIEAIESGNYTSKVDKYFKYFYKKSNTLLDYIEKDRIIFLDEVSKIKARADNIQIDTNNVIKNLIEKEKIIPNILENIQTYEEFIQKALEFLVVYIQVQDTKIVDIENGKSNQNKYNFRTREVNFYKSSIDLLFEELQSSIKSKKRTIILRRKRRKCKKSFIITARKRYTT